MTRAIVVGASIGGLTAAETLRQEGFDGEIVLLGDERHLPYSRPSLSKQILLGEWDADRASIRTIAETNGLRIDLLTSCTALGLDVPARVVHTSQGDLQFDELIVATGSEPRRHPRLPMALTLRKMDDALALRDGIESARRVVIVGAGVLASEVASAARKHDADVLLVGRSGALSFGGVGTLLSARLLQLHEEHGVALALGAQIADAEQVHDGVRLRLTDGRSETGDLVVAVIGGTPRTAWLEASGLTIEDGVVCDSAGRAAPGISAIGDVAAWRDSFTNRPIRVEHQSNAIEQAIAVAVRIVHGRVSSPPVPFFWSEIHRARIQAYGWFDPRRALVAPDGRSPSLAPVTVSRDESDRVRGAIGWNAAPRDFRAARAAVVPAPQAFTTSA